MRSDLGTPIRKASDRTRIDVLEVSIASTNEKVDEMKTLSDITSLSKRIAYLEEKDLENKKIMSEFNTRCDLQMETLNSRCVKYKDRIDSFVIKNNSNEDKIASLRRDSIRKTESIEKALIRIESLEKLCKKLADNNLSRDMKMGSLNMVTRR
jgi:hypothetical protein